MKSLIRTLILCALACSPSVLFSQSFSWERKAMDASRTGVKASSSDNVSECMGYVSGRRYYAPNGRVFKGGSVRKVAEKVLEVQPQMADVKQVVAYSTAEMTAHKPESALSDWFVDILMSETAARSGKKVDIGFANFGGIRVSMPEGNVLLDDIMSMFPFKNTLCYLDLKGSDVRVILEQMASEGFQVIGGVRCVAKDRKLVSATVSGEPLDDNKVYGVATISFLLDGGDGYSIAKNAVSLQMLPDYIIDAVLPYVRKLTAEGKPIEYKTDGRVQILK